MLNQLDRLKKCPCRKTIRDEFGSVRLLAGRHQAVGSHGSLAARCG
jgi:hypothetical protein